MSNLDAVFPFVATLNPHYDDWQCLDAESLYEVILDGMWNEQLVGVGTN